MLFINWLQNHLLPCPFKYLTGIDCPGCGFQRAIIALTKGKLHESFLLYPPAIPLLLIGGFYITNRFVKLDDDKGTLKKFLFLLAGTVIMVSYSIKMWGVYHNYTASAAAM
jgi:hypothetical protein